MTLIRLQDCPPSPWKNGGGSTRQLLISPAGAGLDDFDYRVSLASAWPATGRSRASTGWTASC
ncbi:HutD family protein [Chromobacterium haemolyticum]|nr:HutD family protein [Chromobacterium haemolyticum]